MQSFNYSTALPRAPLHTPTGLQTAVLTRISDTLEQLDMLMDLAAEFRYRTGSGVGGTAVAAARYFAMRQRCAPQDADEAPHYVFLPARGFRDLGQRRAVSA